MISECPAIIGIFKRRFLIEHIANLVCVGELKKRCKNTLECLHVFMHDLLDLKEIIVFIRKISEQEQLIRRDPYVHRFRMLNTHYIGVAVILLRSVVFQFQRLRA